MVRIAALRMGLVGVAIVAVLTACSAAPAASPIPVASPSTAPSATAIPSPSASEVPASTDSPSPSTSPKPRPSIDQADLDAILTSSITLLDLADGDLAVTVAFIDPESDEAFDLGTYTLGFTDQQTNQVPPGTYRLEFRQPADNANGSTCTFELGDGEAYTFAAIEGAVAIGTAGEAPIDARELFVATSSLCTD